MRLDLEFAAAVDEEIELPLDGIDNQGRYIIDGFNGIDAFNDDNQINTSSSVWRLKVGVSYEFCS